MLSFLTLALQETRRLEQCNAPMLHIVPLIALLVILSPVVSNAVGHSKLHLRQRQIPALPILGVQGARRSRWPPPPSLVLNRVRPKRTGKQTIQCV